MTELERIRHSCAHVLATAICEIWPDAQFAAGPPVENGFYYDVELAHRISPEDFARIEAGMRKVVAAKQSFVKEIVSREKALQLAQEGRLAALKSRTQASKFKLDILQNIPSNEPISLYHNGEFIDLCAGPHVEDTAKIGAFRLTHVASAYYKGDERNPQLQRIYGTAFLTQAELEAYFNALEEAKKRDHRKLGRELKLFHIDDTVGQGLILWTPNGAVLRQELQNFISAELKKQGYYMVFTPHIGKLELYRTSGHFPYYQEAQYPPLIERDSLNLLSQEGCSCAELSNRLNRGEIDGYLLKPMNCPHHIKIFASEPRSYRDLPVRLAEFGTVYRWEQSGELNGMTRVRGFTQDDAHLFCTEEQVAQELVGCLALVRLVLTTLGMTDYRVRVGLRDLNSDKYIGEASNWEKAEAACREAVKNLDVPFSEEAGEAAFYGPKIDFVVKDVIGREWQLGTVQVDYNLPVRFDLSYVGSDGKSHRPVMIHRAPFGSLERFCGLLIEHFAGTFPLWLSPEQVRIIPITDQQIEIAKAYEQQLLQIGARVSLDQSHEKLGAKIRLAQMEKVFYMLVVGAKEATTNSVSVRSRTQGDEGVKPFTEWLAQFSKEIATKSK